MIDIADYGYDSDPMTGDGAEGQCVARVMTVHRDRFELVCAHGMVYAQLKASAYYSAAHAEPFPTTGDFVWIDYIEHGDSQIVNTCARRTFFSRRDPAPNGGEQAVAANFDTVFVLMSLNNDFNLRRLERYLTIARQSGAEVAVLLTKADLAESYERELIEAQALAADIPVYAISAVTGLGMEQLSPYLLPRRTLVLLGSSGVGKSSLVNALAGAEIMDVQGIREDDSKGRHTTTRRQLVRLENGLMLIDTPGMRTLGMWEVSAGLSETFADVEELLGQCRFSDCKHESEPGCVIKQAIADGRLTQGRWDNYCGLQREARYAERKALRAKEKQDFHKTLAKWGKQERRMDKQLRKKEQ